MYFVYVEYYYDTDFREFETEEEARHFIDFVKQTSSECLYGIKLIKGDFLS